MILAALVVAGCDPGARVQFIEEISATDPTVSRTQAPDDEGVLSVPSSRLGEVANDVGAVRYDLNSQKRAYLLEGDLAEGVSRTMGFLHLPQLAPDATGPRTVNILPFDRRKWGSVRVYDTGLCSMAPARSPIEATEALEWRNFAHFLVDTIDASFATRGGARTTDATFDVTLNASPPVAMPRNDAFRFSVVYNHVDFDSPCTSGTVTIRASVGLTRVMGELSNVPQCPTRADTSGGRRTIAGTADFPGIVHFLEVIVEGGGALCSEEDIAISIDGRLRPALTAGLATVIRDRLLVDPRTFGFADADIPRCTCDDECNSFGAGPIPYPGRRHRCHFYTPGESCGECWLQLEADRISMRPEGLEIVLAEDTDDVQWSIFDGTPGGSYLCRPTRLPIVGYGSRPMPGALPFPSIAPPPPPPPPTEPPTCPLAGL